MVVGVGRVFWFCQVSSVQRWPTSGGWHRLDGVDISSNYPTNDLCADPGDHYYMHVDPHALLKPSGENGCPRPAVRKVRLSVGVASRIAANFGLMGISNAVLVFCWRMWITPLRMCWRPRRITSARR